MARAVQVFKDNAVELLERKIQLEQVNLQLDVALNNMTHGLCMFDGSQRLIICNGRYGSMYALPEYLTKPGTTLVEFSNIGARTAVFFNVWTTLRCRPGVTATPGLSIRSKNCQMVESFQSRFKPCQMAAGSRCTRI